MKERRNQAISAINQKSRPQDIPSPYKEGDQVWLEATHLHLPYQATKLAPKRQGPFQIMKQISPVAFQLELPTNWGIHNVFHASLLSPYRETEAHGPNFSRPPPDLIDGEDEYEVERILDHRRHRKSRTLQYLIKWKGYPLSDSTWEDETQVFAPDLMRTYLEQYKRGRLQRKKGRHLNPAILQCLVSPCKLPSPCLVLLHPSLSQTRVQAWHQVESPSTSKAPRRHPSVSLTQ
jgi:Chromo (CHRromatin Organisation MOdifier) domain